MSKPNHIRSNYTINSRHNNHSSSSQPTYFLQKSIHPVLDGVGEIRRHNRIQNGRKRNHNHTSNKPIQREWSSTILRSNSEFINNKNGFDDANLKDDSMEIDENVDNATTTNKVKTEEIDRNDDNVSDDEQEQEEIDEAATEVPTLDTYIPRKPTYHVANAIPFAELCRRLEVIWNLRFKKKKVTKAERIAFLLPKAMKDKMDESKGSPYPYLRLILPDHDSARPHSGLKESKVAETWAKALGQSKGSKIYSLLTGYRNGKLVKNQDSIGDLSCVVMDVMKERQPGSGSKLTVGEINEWLDVVVDVVKDRFDMPTVDPIEKSKWRKQLEKAVKSGPNSSKKLKGDMYAALVEKLISKNMSPEEHKYIVRILMQEIHVGINLREVLGYLDPNAQDIHNSANSLKELCTLLSDPDYVKLLRTTVEKNTQDIMENNRSIWMTRSLLPAAIQKTLSPMLSRKTSFETFLKEVCHRHNQLDKALPSDSPAKSCLAIRHPAFLSEIKMDGERMMVHIKRGIVTMQTRRGVWYSPCYSPAIGPTLRTAIAAYDVDVILDGEMISWDDEEDNPIPFGSNRTVAAMQRLRRKREGTLDPRDADLHKNDLELNIQTLSKDESLRRGEGVGSSKLVDSDQYWLQYVIFDILYVDGPGAKDLLSKSRHLFGKDDSIQTGSIINMDLMQRKSILYNLVKPQKNEVVINRSIIIRSDGTRMDAFDYFLGRKGLEYGRTPCELDSIYLALCDKSGTTKFDSQRMAGKNHEEIEVCRSMALQHVFDDVVTTGGQEGLLLKDLASPYFLGAPSRNQGYWWKIKPDYDASGTAADIDLLIIGGFWSDGFDKRGLLSAIMLGCLDPEHPYGDEEGNEAKYMAVSKCNFAKFVEKTLLEETGFQRATDDTPMQMGKWFESEDIPDYYSQICYQRNPDGDKEGWKPPKKDRPEVFIKPEDSFVVTVNASEYMTSKSSQTGFILRFPRITKYRGKTSDDPKRHDSIENWSQMKTVFDEQEESRQDAVLMGSQAQTKPQTSRFLTARQLQMSGREKKARNSRKQTNEVKQFSIPEAGARLSSVLEGFVFSVQPGNYCLENDDYAKAQAERDGWAAEAAAVTSQKDVIKFIQSHGGTCQLAVHRGTDFLLGGTITDAPVSNLKTLMENTDRDSTAKKEADARRLLEMGGVLKWTFVYSIVSKCLKELDDSSGYERTIKNDWPHLAEPRRSDFLVMSDAAKTNLQSSEDDYGLRINQIAKPLEFGRALEEVGRQMSIMKKRRGDDTTPWQTLAMNSFDENERWIFGGKIQKLWPYSKESRSIIDDEDNSLFILYPDLFDDLGFEEQEDADKESSRVVVSPRWEETMASKKLGKVNAALPLAKALGAIVTPHLHSGVTHVVCDLRKHKTIKWSSMHPLTIYSDIESGKLLNERLISLEESAAISRSGERSVMLVSPEWLEEQIIRKTALKTPRTDKKQKPKPVGKAASHIS